MAIGVSYSDFWYGEPEIVNFAIETAELTQKNDAILSDVAAWSTGRYVMLGVGVVLSQAFSRNSQAKYPAEPMLAYELDEQLAEQKRERELRKQHTDFLAVAARLELRNQNGGTA
jgi:outer membrane scaffolding protein for murein synthesis (MipA/OmpV family)